MSLGDIPQESVFGLELGNLQIETVKSISGIAVGQEVIEVKENTPEGEIVVRKQPGQRTSGEITLTRGLAQSDAFTDWLNQTLVDKDIEGARQNVAIVVMDAQKKVLSRIHLTNTWATQWTMNDLDAGQTGPAEETVTITYEESEIEKA